MHHNKGLRLAVLITSLAALLSFNAYGVETLQLNETPSLINPLNSSKNQTDLKEINLSTTQEANATDNGFCITPVYPQFVEDLYHFPQDIELTVERVHPAAPGPGADHRRHGLGKVLHVGRPGAVGRRDAPLGRGCGGGRTRRRGGGAPAVSRRARWTSG